MSLTPLAANPCACTSASPASSNRRRTSRFDGRGMHSMLVDRSPICGRRRIDIVGGDGRDTQLAGNRVDSLLRGVEVDLAVGGEVWTDVALVVLLGFVTRESIEEPGDVID